MVVVVVVVVVAEVAEAVVLTQQQQQQQTVHTVCFRIYLSKEDMKWLPHEEHGLESTVHSKILHTLPVSTTYLMPGIVSEVSATLVATTTSLLPSGGGWNTRACLFGARSENIGRMCKGTWSSAASESRTLSYHVKGQGFGNDQDGKLFYNADFSGITSKSKSSISLPQTWSLKGTG